MKTSKSSSASFEKKLCDFLDQNKAQDVVLIDLRGKSGFADFMIIGTGTSQRFIKALAEKTRDFLSENGIKNVHLEGLTSCDWVLVDSPNLIIHLFRPEIREIYNLEKMWDPKFLAEMEQQNTPPLAYHPRAPQPRI